MDKKEEFKAFVKENPRLVKYIKNGEMTWQKFYEIYDIYGKDENAWKDYLTAGVASVAATSASAFSFNDMINWVKGIDLDSVQSGIGNLQRVIGMVQDLTAKDSTEVKKEEYKPRPLYKHFDD